MAEDPKPKRRTLVLVGAMLVLAGAAAWGEQQGWPWLVQPAADAVGRLLGREVKVASVGQQARLHFWGGLRFDAPRLSVSAPDWAAHRELMVIEEGAVGMGYGALWRLTRGGDVHLQRLTARRLQGWLERDANGRSNWTFGDTRPRPEASASAAWPAVQVDVLSLGQARIGFNDAPTRLKATVVASVVPLPGQGAVESSQGWQVAALAEGSYRDLPIKVSAKSSSPWQFPQSGQLEQVRWPLEVQARVGRAEASFKGLAASTWLQGPVTGEFHLSGPSLAAVGEPLGVTLPTTAAFRMHGQLRLEGLNTHVEVVQARIGKSDLRGTFDHRRGQGPPLLTGRLQGRRLALIDLGPAVGVPSATTPATEEAKAQRTRVLPDRAFNLPSLAAMNAHVLVDIDVFDTGNAWLQPMTALKGRIVLKDSVLRLEDLSTRLAKGNVKGLISLDGRDPAKAILHAALDVDGVKIEQWVPALQREARSAYLSGDIVAHVDVTGQGRSTAQLLSSLNGQIEAVLSNGQISRLGVELAGLDIMQGLFEWVKGDDSLPIGCARMVWTARHGVLQPHPAIVSTKVTTLWADGSISIPEETLDLRARVAPKDITLVALRTPIRVTGSWQQPQVQVLNTSTWLRLLGSAALMTVNPIAGIVPLVDTGQRDEARLADARCLAAPLPR
jgi:uncharacterized protein involved in outer membrane biogenesis